MKLKRIKVQKNKRRKRDKNHSYEAKENQILAKDRSHHPNYSSSSLDEIET